MSAPAVPLAPPRRARLAPPALDAAAASGWIFALAGVVVLVGIGLRGPWPADEPRFAQIAREMVESGHWLFPTRGGELYSDKPPLFVWAIAALHAAGASLRVAFLLPSALAALGTLALVHDLARRWWDRRTANVAALALLATPQFVLQAKSAQIDMTVTFWITLGAWGLLGHLVRVGPAADGARFGAYLLGWLAMGLGVVTKGVGFLPALLLAPWAALLAAGRGGRGTGGVALARPAFRQLAGPLAFAVPIALWLVPILLAARHDPALAAYRDDILLRQTAERYVDSWTHLEPWHYFLVSVIPVFWLPTTALLPWLAGAWRAAWRRRDPRVVLPLAWIALVVLFFSASPGKRGVYVLPCVPMLALAAAPFLGAALARPRVAALARAGLAALAVALLAVGAAGLLGAAPARAVELREGIRPWGLVCAVGALAAGAALASRPGRAGRAWLAFVLPTWLLWSSWGYVVADEGRTPANVYRGVARALAVEGERGAVELGLVDFREQYLLYSPYPIVHFGFATPVEAQLAEAWRWVGEAPGRRLLLADGFPLGCYRPERAPAVGRAHGRDWRLYGADARAPRCAPPARPVPRHRYAQDGALPVALRPAGGESSASR